MLYNLAAVAAMLAIFFFVYYGHFMDPAFAKVYGYFQSHQTQAVLAAATPFFASLLVGWGYARRAARRRAREERGE